MLNLTLAASRHRRRNMCDNVICVSSADDNNSSSLTASEWPKLLQQGSDMGTPKHRPALPSHSGRGDVVKQDFAEAIRNGSPRQPNRRTQQKNLIWVSCSIKDKV